MTLREDVLITTVAMAESISAGEQAVVENLMARGYSELRAEVLLAFVPLGLGRAIISRLPDGPSIVLPDKAVIKDGMQGRQFIVRLADVPEYVTARNLGEETFLNGCIPRHHLSASCNSVELNLLSDALNKNVEIAGAVISPSILLRLAYVPGFQEWYERTSNHTCSS